MKVLVPDDGEPKASVAISNVPEPTGQEGNVHAPGGQNPQTTLVLGFADVRSAHHMVLLLIALTSPEESGLVLGDLLMQRLMKAIEAHEEP